MNQQHTSADVSVVSARGPYPTQCPFDPAEPYPEVTGLAIGREPNTVYHAVRDALKILGLDNSHLGATDWNPMGVLVPPGDTVLLKPNLIRESHVLHVEQWEQVITHGSVVRPVLDHVGLALDGRGTIVIGDGPQTDSDFHETVRGKGLEKVSMCRGDGVKHLGTCK